MERHAYAGERTLTCRTESISKLMMTEAERLRRARKAVAAQATEEERRRLRCQSTSKIVKQRQRKKGVLVNYKRCFRGDRCLLIVLQVVGQSTAKNNHGVMRYGNYQSLRVLTDSMEPIYKVDTMVFVNVLIKNTKDIKRSIRWGRHYFVRNYRGSYDLPGDKRIVTHRIHRIEVQADGRVYSGRLVIIFTLKSVQKVVVH